MQISAVTARPTTRAVRAALLRRGLTAARLGALLSGAGAAGPGHGSAPPAQATRAAPDADEAAALDEAGPVRRAPRVPWITGRSWDDLRDEATAAGRPILIDFTAAWCGPCKLLDVMVFTEKAVIGGLADVVTVKVDIDHPGADDLPGRFGIEVVPTVIWCDPRGVEQDRFTGYVSSAEFLETLATWRRGLTLDQTLAARLRRSPQDPAVLLDLAQREAGRGRLDRADTAYRRLLNLRGQADPVLVAEGLLGLAEMEREAGRAERARSLTARAAGIFAARVDEGAEVAEVLPGLMSVAEFQAADGDTLGALDSWRAMRDLDPRNPAILEGYARAALAAGRDLEDATKAALRATVYSDKDAAVIGLLAECYRRRGLYDRALRWIDQSIERDPAEPRYRRQRETILAEQAARRGGRR